MNRKANKNKAASRKVTTEAGAFAPKVFALLLLLVLAASFLIYLPALPGKFLNWDDPLYVTDSPWIRLSLKNIAALITNGQANLPLTRLSLSLNHAVSGFEPWSYHLVNLLLHLLNTFLVFRLVFLIMKARDGRGAEEVALITAAFFGVHPLHVESIAWVAERKDVLYTAFFLGSLICYWKYLRGFGKSLFIWSLVLFLLSLAAKAQAVTLPFILVALDWLARRKTTRGRWLLEKGPFLALALIYGLGQLLRTKGLQIADPDFFDPAAHFILWERLVFSGYAYTHYLIKTGVPWKLSVIYPYPEITGGTLSLYYWIYLLPFIATIGLLVYGVRRSREAVFAALLFLVNIVITFQTLIGITPSVMNDRYIYLASVGIFFLFAILVRQAMSQWSAGKNGIRAALLVSLVLLSIISFQRSKVWKDSLTLWNDVLAKYDRVAIAWINRGEAQAGLGNFPGARQDFDRALEIDSRNSLAWSNRGAAKIKMGDLQGALPDLSQALLLNPANGDAYLNRGTARVSLGDLQGALNDYNRAITLQPGSVKAWTNRGFTKIIQGDLRGALEDCSRALALAPEFGKALWGRGSAKVRLGNRDGGCFDLKKAWDLGVSSTKKELDEFCRDKLPEWGRATRTN